MACFPSMDVRQLNADMSQWHLVLCDEKLIKTNQSINALYEEKQQKNRRINNKRTAESVHDKNSSEAFSDRKKQTDTVAVLEYLNRLRDHMLQTYGDALPPKPSQRDDEHSKKDVDHNADLQHLISLSDRPAIQLSVPSSVSSASDIPIKRNYSELLPTAFPSQRSAQPSDDPLLAHPTTPDSLQNMARVSSPSTGCCIRGTCIPVQSTCLTSSLPPASTCAPTLRSQSRSRHTSSRRSSHSVLDDNRWSHQRSRSRPVALVDASVNCLRNPAGVVDPLNHLVDSIHQLSLSEVTARQTTVPHHFTQTISAQPTTAFDQNLVPNTPNHNLQFDGFQKEISSKMHSDPELRNHTQQTNHEEEVSTTQKGKTSFHAPAQGDLKSITENQPNKFEHGGSKFVRNVTLNPNEVLSIPATHKDGVLDHVRIHIPRQILPERDHRADSSDSNRTKTDTLSPQAQQQQQQQQQQSQISPAPFRSVIARRANLPAVPSTPEEWKKVENRFDQLQREKTMLESKLCRLPVVAEEVSRYFIDGYQVNDVYFTVWM
ncbi:uncharacterized protein DEA37_0006000 [Paragonimus westermani]|uniref:Uncharacterized protein n=1 Tax=Paragonimus westermani TaxID=34504 RepID=A0A5J4P2Z1_9TREM|nr:uncharacterized protein DEA37_0006000 [Paragonimus westermani]